MLLERINNSKKVWIYGIGVVGKRLCQTFGYFGIDIAGILVTSMSDNIDAFRGIKVSEFEALSFGETDLIIVTAVGRAKEEISNNLEKNGVDFIVWEKELLDELWKSCTYKFEGHIIGKSRVCIVLSGYKEYLWENVYRRLKENVPEDVEVCLCSAGKYVSRLSAIAKSNGWTYLFTEINSVSLLQNICIALHSNAKWIYKMDEDMFVTKNMFNNMQKTADEIISSKMYEFGLCSPLIPVNAIGYRYILEKYNGLNDYENRFGSAFVGGNPHREIEKNPDTAKYMWGEGTIPHLDVIAEDMQCESEYEICNTRLNIGLILFKRELWELMQGFTVYGNMDLGIDEEDINSFCINNSRVMVISKGAIAGHFGFGKQTKEMCNYYQQNTERF